MRATLLSLALSAFASGTRGEPPPVPRLLVLVSVDQMRADYLDRFPASGQGGFSRLLREGAAFSQARNTDVPTETSPGHATLLTGRPPSAHCVVGYDWFDEQAGRTVYSVEDPVFRLSPRHLQSPTLGDALKARDPVSLVVSVSGKDRSGILLGGHRPDAALWYDPREGDFKTSPYYGPLPSWAARFNSTLTPAALRPQATAYFSDLTLSPAFDRLVFDAALEAVRSLSMGSDGRPDLLAVGISGVDIVGHRHGPDGPQMREQLEGLDKALGDFLSRLDRLVGRERYALILTSDHGVLPVPESPAGKALGARRVLFRDWLREAEEALDARLPSPGKEQDRPPRTAAPRPPPAPGKEQDRPPRTAAPRPPPAPGEGRWIAEGFPPQVRLDRARAARSGLGRDALLREAASALAGLDTVAEVFTSSQLEGFETASSSYAAVFRRAYCPGRSGDLMVLLKPFVFIADGPEGTGHGLPYDYDSRVPLLFAGPGILPGRRDARVSLEDIAPTAARLLGVDFPPAPGYRVLEEVFEPPASGSH